MVPLLGTSAFVEALMSGIGGNTFNSEFGVHKNPAGLVSKSRIITVEYNSRPAVSKTPKTALKKIQ